MTLSSKYKQQLIYSLCLVLMRRRQYSSPSCSISIPFLMVTVLPWMIVEGTIQILSSRSDPTDMRKWCCSVTLFQDPFTFFLTRMVLEILATDRTRSLCPSKMIPVSFAVRTSMTFSCVPILHAIQSFPSSTRLVGSSWSLKTFKAWCLSLYFLWKAKNVQVQDIKASTA